MRSEVRLAGGYSSAGGFSPAAVSVSADNVNANLQLFHHRKQIVGGRRHCLSF